MRQHVQYHGRGRGLAVRTAHHDALFALLSDYASKKEYKTGFVMWPIRTALSGNQMTPAGATEIMEVLGKDESIARLKKGVSLLESAIG